MSMQLLRRTPRFYSPNFDFYVLDFAAENRSKILRLLY